ncbi:AMP-binding protein [Novosphingobium sp.]|uniref:AMP-binding protein n=1 Tax=Novosphingobium sp. TaxID=1874826 RepID=UPI002FDA9D6A
MGSEHARGQSLSLLLRRSARRHRSKTALICGSEQLSYSDLDRLADSLANGLLREGVKPGDRVAILARNSHAFVTIRFAVARAGAVLVPINFMLGEEEARYILDHSGAFMPFVDASTSTIGRVAASPNLLIFGLPGGAHRRS